MQNEKLFYTFIESQNVVVLSRDYAPSQMTYTVSLFGYSNRINTAREGILVMQPHGMLPNRPGLYHKVMSITLYIIKK